MSKIEVALAPVEAGLTLRAPPAPPPPAGFDPTPFRAAVDQYRTTARWVIGAFAAVGTLIAGAVPFAAFSGVDRSSSEFAVVVFGAVLALAGVGIAIASTAASLVPRSVYPHDVSARAGNWLIRAFSAPRAVADALFKHPNSLLPAGIDSLPDLLDAIDNLEAEIARRRSQNLDATNLERRKAECENAYLQLQWLIRFEKARRAFRAALVATVVGAVAAGAGIGLLLNGLEDKKGAAEVNKLNAEARKLDQEAANTQAEAKKANAESTKLESDRRLVDAQIAKTLAEAEKTLAEAANLRATPP